MIRRYGVNDFPCHRAASLLVLAGPADNGPRHLIGRTEVGEPDHALSIDHALVQLVRGLERHHDVILREPLDHRATEDERASQVSAVCLPAAGQC